MLIIRHGPIIRTNTPSDTKVGSKQGSPVSLQCDVDAYPEPTIQWKEYRTDKIIESGADGYVIKNTASFSRYWSYPYFYRLLEDNLMNCSSVRLLNVFDQGLHRKLWCGFMQGEVYSGSLSCIR